MTSWKNGGVLAVLLAGALLACTDDDYVVPPPTGPGAAVGALRVNVSTTQTLILYNDGRITLGPLSFFRPNAPITVDLLDHNGNVIANPDTAVLRVNIGSATTGTVNFTRVDNLRGTLVGGTNPGSTTLQIGLFDKNQRKTVFGPYPVPVLSR